MEKESAQVYNKQNIWDHQKAQNNVVNRKPKTSLIISNISGLKALANKKDIQVRLVKWSTKCCLYDPHQKNRDRKVESKIWKAMPQTC